MSAVRTLVPGVGLGLGLGLGLAGWLGAAGAQEAHPVLHQAPHHTKHMAETHPPRKHVPVVAPRHAGPPRRLPHGKVAAKVAAPALEAPKPVAAKPPAPPKKPPVPPDIGTNTGLKLPRYAALKTDDANMRSGPGERYPVIWQYQRHDLPVRIEREFDVWRLVEDMDGIKGWVHQATLTGRRSFIIIGADDVTLRAEGSEAADAVAVLKPGVIGRVKSCDGAASWCQVQVGDYRGWLKRGDVWGVDTGEVVAP